MKNINQLQQTILKQAGTFTVGQLIAESGVSNAYISQTLTKMQMAGQIEKLNNGKPQLWKVKGQVDANAPKLPVATRFEYIRNLVNMVITGVQPSVMITGQPGIGKSFLVRDELKKADLEINEDYLSVSGHSSPFGLFKLLHDNRESMIVFDDTDSILGCDICQNILKAALDSYDTRWVSWYSNKAEQQDLDPCFEFKGRIIFISNMYAEKINPAIRSRAFCFDLKMSNSEITEHMDNILKDIETKVPLNLKKEALEFLKTIENTIHNYSLRTLIQAIRIRAYCVDTNKDWQQMIKTVALTGY